MVVWQGMGLFSACFRVGAVVWLEMCWSGVSEGARVGLAL